MRMKRALFIAATAMALATGGCATTAGRSTGDRAIMGPVPLRAQDSGKQRAAAATILFWSDAERDANFKRMEQIFPVHVVKAGGAIHPLSAGLPLPISDAAVNAYMEEGRVAGLIVLQDGKVRLERYARGFDASARWTSFSVAKSFSSTLVGAAIHDGYIKSVDDPVTAYIPELAGSAYDGVTVAQLLTMTSGARWNEDYTDPKSDVASMYAKPVPPGIDPTVAYMRTLAREAPPGTKWVYKTGETNLVGVLVARATHKPLANYLSEKVWKPYGMEADAYWMVDTSGQEIGGCCLSVRLRDYARMGQFVLEGGKGAVNADWFPAALSTKAELEPGYGYGYQWWTYPLGTYGAQGIFGQTIFIDPTDRLVVVMVSNWPHATGNAYGDARREFTTKLIVASKAR